MIELSGRLLLLDIEGTTSDFAFVHTVLFPYARREVAGYLERNTTAPALADALNQLARDAGAANFEAWCPHLWPAPGAREWVVAKVNALMDVDSKQTGLKRLQGLIWATGYGDGSLRSHLFPDVKPKLEECVNAGHRICIYSSGSIGAQKLFFAHTEMGDLTVLLSGHYDTTVGAKRETESYGKIARNEGLDPQRILFLSDIPEELDAARGAGLGTVLVERPGNRPVGDCDHPRIQTFEEIAVK